MFRQARPRTPLDWGVGICFGAAIFLITWSTFTAEWWSTSVGLNIPLQDRAAADVLAESEGQTLLDAYAWVAITLLVLAFVGALVSAAVLGPYAFIRDRRFLFAVVASGVIGTGLTIVATQLDSTVTGLVATNAWIPAGLGWVAYFGGLVVALVARDPQLEFEPRPDSSDG